MISINVMNSIKNRPLWCHSSNTRVYLTISHLFLPGEDEGAEGRAVDHALRPPRHPDRPPAPPAARRRAEGAQPHADPQPGHRLRPHPHVAAPLPKRQRHLAVAAEPRPRHDAAERHRRDAAQQRAAHTLKRTGH